MSLSLEHLLRDSDIAAPKASLAAQLMSFLFIGGLAAISYVGLAAVMIDLGTGLPDWLMSALCYAAFVGPVYLAHRHVSFRSNAPHAQALPRYIALQLCGIGLASAFSYLCYGVLGLPTMTAAILVIALTSGFNFVIVRAWAFAEGH